MTTIYDPTRPTEFDCIDCGDHVFRVVSHFANDQHLCAICEFIRTVEDPGERDALKRRLKMRSV